MKLGIATNETWAFLTDLYEDFSKHWEINIFQGRTTSLPVFRTRINNYLFKRDLRSFMLGHDVVFFEWASELLAAATQLPKSCAIVTRLHRYELYQWADKINWDNVDRIITVSHAKQQEFASRFPAHAAKVVVIPVGISLQKFRFSSKKFNGDIGILCHLRPRKRVYDLILAFSELAQQREPVQLHIGGAEVPGFEEYYTALQVLVQKLNLHAKVKFYGSVTEPQEWYQNIDILISNSYSEGLQVSPMEGMASGCYCLSHYWEGAEELLPEENLFYTANEMNSKIHHYCDLAETERAAKRAYMRSIACERFNLDKIKLQIRQLLEEAVATAK